jgi:hypothetical protein
VISYRKDTGALMLENFYQLFDVELAEMNESWGDGRGQVEYICTKTDLQSNTNTYLIKCMDVGATAGGRWNIYVMYIYNEIFKT